jgi:hypothetical protein
MKHVLSYLGIFLASVFAVQAQPGNPANREQKIQALYVAYVTQQLALTEDEAQKFWPVHAQYSSELKAVNKNMNELEVQQASLNVKKKYQDRFVKILGNERTNSFFKVDEEFRKKLVERLRKMRQNKQKSQRLINR